MYCVAQNKKPQKDYFYIIESIKPELISISEKPFIDSILTLYHKTKNDTLRLGYLNILTEFSNDEKIWAVYNDYVLEFCILRIEEKSSVYTKKELKYFKQIYSSALNNKGYQLSEHGKVQEALDKYEECIKIKSEIGDSLGMASSYNNMAYIFLKKGIIPNALTFFEKSKMLYEKAKDLSGLANCINNLGYIYKTQGETETAKKYYLEGLEIQRQINDIDGIATSLGNLGAIYEEQGLFDTSLALSKQSIYLKLESGNSRGATTTICNVGIIFLENNMPDSAILYFNTALKISKEIDYKEGICISTQHLGNAFVRLNDIPKAKNYGLEALRIAEELGFPQNIHDAAETLRNIFMIENDWKGAYEMQTLLHAMKDSILNQSNKDAALKQMLKFDYEKKEHKLQVEKEKQQAVFEEKTKRDIIIILSISGFALLSLFFLIYVFIKFRQSKKQQNLIDNQKEELQYAYEYLSLKNTQVMDSINYAKKLQQALMASETDLLTVFPNSFAFMKPKDSLSGDFFWCKEKEVYKYCAVVDCTGHGVPGAIISIIAQRILDKALENKTFSDPAQMLNFLNFELENVLYQENNTDLRAGFDISLIIYNTISNELKFAAAHNYGLYISKNEPYMIPADNCSIGRVFGKQKEKKFTCIDFNPQKGDMIYLFTDGYRDQFGGDKKEKFYYQNLENLLLSIHYEPMSVQRESTKNTFNKWKGIYEQVDDVCLIGIRF